MGFAELHQGCHFRYEDELVANVPVLRIFCGEPMGIRLSIQKRPKSQRNCSFVFSNCLYFRRVAIIIQPHEALNGISNLTVCVSRVTRDSQPLRCICAPSIANLKELTVLGVKPTSAQHECDLDNSNSFCFNMKSFVH